MYLLLIIIAFWLFTNPVSADLPEIYSIRAPESTSDQRYEYDHAVIELALEKTKGTHGPYEIKVTPPMNYPRAVASAQTNKYPNFFIKHTYEKSLGEGNLSYVLFPVDLGIVGYRVCFLSETIKEKVETASDLKQIRTFSHGQGKGWSDVAILRHHGMRVVEVAIYENLFGMVARNRFDLFCRGVNELLNEYESHKHIEGLAYDSSMSIAYPLPRFFYTHKGNIKAIKRVKAGLVAAYNDGSLIRLWLDHYKPSIDFAHLNERHIYRIENPRLKGLENGYQKYFYDPFEKPSKKSTPEG